QVEDPADDDTEREEVQPRDVAKKRDVAAGRALTPAVLEVERHDSERNHHDELSDDLAPSAQTEAPLGAHRHVVVDEADGAESDHQPDDEERRQRWRASARVGADEIADNGAEDEDDTAHRGRAALGAVARVRDVFGRPDDLPPAQPAEQTQEDG